MSGRRGRGGGRGQTPLPIRPSARDDASSARGGAGGRGGRGSRGGGGGGGGAPAGPTIFSHGPDSPARRNDVIVNLEDKIEQGVLRKSASALEQNPFRPGFGTRGKQILLWANYMELTFPKPRPLHRYQVEIRNLKKNEDVKGKAAQRPIELLLEQHFVQQRPDIVTDFRQYLISATKLDISQQPFEVTMHARGEDLPSPDSKRHRIRMALTYQGTQDVGLLINYLSSTDPVTHADAKEVLIQDLNILIGHNPKESHHVASIGANRHYQASPPDDGRFHLSPGLEAIRGFFLSVRAATGRLILNVQPKHSPFYVSGPLDNCMKAFIEANGGDPRKLGRFLKGVAVDAAHVRHTNSDGNEIPRTRVIAGLATPNDGNQQAHRPVVPKPGAGPKQVQFWLEMPPAQGYYVTVYDFFHKQHKITIRDTNLPVVNVGNEANPVYLPAQVCHLIKGQPFRGQLSPGETQQMIKFAVRKPKDNAQSVVKEGHQMITLDQNSKPTFDRFNINIANRLITVPGRVLAPPSVQYASKKTISPNEGGWNMTDTKLSTTKPLPSWTWLYVSTPETKIKGPLNDPKDLDKSLAKFKAQLLALGITCSQWQQGSRVEVRPSTKDRGADPGDVDKPISEALRTIASRSSPPPFVLVILGTDKPEVYNRIKFVCDIQEGIANVCVLDTKFANGTSQYLANVGLKVNLKLGAQNQTLDPHHLGLIEKGKTMVVGLDVTHPSPNSSEDAPSIVGIVASIDKSLCQWPAEVRLEKARSEMVSELTDLMCTRLSLWAHYNKSVLPENIIVYRDGVSEGQYKLVLEEELPQIKEACKKKYPADKTKKVFPHITVVIVGKRHHTRFYPTDRDHADSSTNPPSGTIVDRGVTEARNWDFFLQAHTALQGTARPAHYYVIHDEVFRAHHKSLTQGGRQRGGEIQNAADELEDLTFKQCFLFGRATKAVSICPPAYYADLVCDRARRWMGEFFEQDNAPSKDGKGKSGPDSSMLRLHKRVANTMFYI